MLSLEYNRNHHERKLF